MRAQQLVRFARLTRNLKGANLDEAASSGLLIHAGRLMIGDIDPVGACTSAAPQALTDDREMIAAIDESSASAL